jgi:urease accessory protein
VRDMHLSSLDKLEDRMNDDFVKLIDALPSFKEHSEGRGCNLAIAYGMTAVMWQIDENAALTGYLYSWLANLVSAGVKLIPLGQTVGQQILFGFNQKLDLVASLLLMLPDDEMESCSWGAAIASMNHETQYSRLFRS